jgi:hypothetical protein
MTDAPSPCPRCESKRVATGRVRAGKYIPTFEADGMRILPSLAAIFDPEFAVDKATWACVACGLVWTELNPEALRDRLRKGSDLETRVRLMLDVPEGFEERHRSRAERRVDSPPDHST